MDGVCGGIVMKEGSNPCNMIGVLFLQNLMSHY